jgi:hypothetical protein
VAQENAAGSGGRLSVTHEIRDGYEGADVVYANSWGALPYRLQDDRLGAQLGGADLERGARAQRAVQEQQCEGPALQQRPHRIGLKARRLIEKRLQFPDGPVLSARLSRSLPAELLILASILYRL